MKNTIENNKLIAEFMGLIYNEQRVKQWEDENGWRYEELLYHSSWNWLMEVVEKIRSIDSIAKGEFRTNLLHYQRNNKTIFDLSILEGKEYIYNACVEFIKWFNKQNN